MIKVNSECQSCRGTGLYQGFAEKKGEAVICVGCQGTGCNVIEYEPFTQRKIKQGVKTVSRSRGCLIAFGCGPTGDSISYEQFLAGKMPKRVDKYGSIPYPASMNTSIVNFYTSGGKDSQGRRISDIQNFSNRELEESHDYIQWLFPTKTGSQYNPDAPVLDDETIATLRGSHWFHTNFKRSIQRIMSFWRVSRHWQQPDDHNLLRMTRFMESCTLLGYKDEALDLFDSLTYLKASERGKFISDSNVQFWRGALQSR